MFDLSDQTENKKVKEGYDDYKGEFLSCILFQLIQKL